MSKKLHNLLLMSYVVTRYREHVKGMKDMVVDIADDHAW
jgi:hypothetical protein